MKKLILSFSFAFALYGQAVNIGPVVFSGSGLNDATSGGHFSSAPANAQYVVSISATGTPDHFTWTKNGGAASSPVAVTGAAQALSDGVTIKFTATTGHHAGDVWTIAATAAGTTSAETTIQSGLGAVFRSQEGRNRDSVSVLDFSGVDPTGMSDSAAGINMALKASKSLYFPSGTYRCLSPLTAFQRGAHLSGAANGSTVLQFEAGIDGFDFPAGSAADDISLDHITIQSSTAPGGKALNFPGGGTSNFHTDHVTISQSGAGKFAYGLWTSDLESSAFYSLRCFAVDKCIHLQDTSNADAFYGLLIGGPSTTGVETRDVEDVAIFGGTIQGDATHALIDTDGGVKIWGTHLENDSQPLASLVLSSGQISLDGVELSGGGVNAIHHTGSTGIQISHVNSGFNASDCMIRIDGAGFVSGAVTITDNLLYNITTGKPVLCVGSSASGTGVEGLRVAGNYILTQSGTATGIILQSSENVTVEGNILVATPAIDASSGDNSVALLSNTVFASNFCPACGAQTQISLGNWQRGVGPVPNVINSVASLAATTIQGGTIETGATPSANGGVAPLETGFNVPSTPFPVTDGGDVYRGVAASVQTAGDNSVFYEVTQRVGSGTGAILTPLFRVYSGGWFASMPRTVSTLSSTGGSLSNYVDGGIAYVTDSNVSATGACVTGAGGPYRALLVRDTSIPCWKVMFSPDSTSGGTTPARAGAATSSVTPTITCASSSSAVPSGGGTPTITTSCSQAAHSHTQN